MIRNWKTWAAGAFAAFYLLTSPARAADVVNHTFTILGDWGQSLSTFVNHLGDR